MSNQPSIHKKTWTNGVSPGLLAWGSRSWLYLGIALWTLAIVSFLSILSGLAVPLAVAVIMAMLFYPPVDRLEAHRVNRIIGSLLVLFLVVAVIIGMTWVTWVGIFSQSDKMFSHMDAGLVTLADWATVKFPVGLAEQIRVKALEALPPLVSGITGFIFSGISGITAYLIGGFTALFLLYYLLADWRVVSDWVGRHLGVPDELGRILVDEAVSTIRIYYYALTLANLPVALTVGIIMWLLGLPLIVPVVLVTLVSCYIPYLGAIISSIFAALVALGAGGPRDAIIIIVAIIGLQNIIDPIISTYMASDKLKLHPIVTLVTTLSGGILFGALGATLANPVAAILIDARKQVQTAQAEPMDDGTSDQ